MRIRHAALLALLLGGPAAQADPPRAVITGKAAVPAGGVVFLDATKSVSEPGLAVKWVVSPKTPTVVMSSPDDTRPGVYLLLPAAEAGTYRVKLIVRGKPDPAKPEVDADADVTDVTVGQPAPPPGPGPTPGPTPDPASAKQPLFVVIVEETADAVATRGAMLADAALAARMKAKGHRWRVVDKDVVGADGQPPADVKRFLAASSGKGYPQVFIVGADGATAYQGDLPKDAAGVIDLLQKFGG